MSWYTAHILSIITFLPLVGAVVIALLGRERASSARWVALAFSLLTFMITVCLYARFDPQIGGMQFTELRPWIIVPPVNYHLGVDGLSALMILLSGFLTPLAVLVSWNRHHDTPGRILHLPAGAGNWHDGRLRLPRLDPLLCVLGSDVDPHVFPDRNLGT